MLSGQENSKLPRNFEQLLSKLWDILQKSDIRKNVSKFRKVSFRAYFEMFSFEYILKCFFFGTFCKVLFGGQLGKFLLGTFSKLF